MSLDPNAPILTTPQANSQFEVYDERTLKRISYQSLAESLSDYFENGSNNFLNVKSFGAIGNNIADDTQAFQDAINAAASGGRVLFVPSGTYKVGTIFLPDNGSQHYTIVGSSQSGAKIRNTTGDLFVSDLATNCNFVDLEIICSAGDVFSGWFVGCVFERLTILQNSTNKSILFHDGGNGNSHNLLENTFRNCDLFGTLNHTVPLIYIRSSNGSVSLNHFENLRCTFSGDYFFHLESTSSQSYCYSNIIENINFEVTNNGNIRLRGCYNTIIRNCNTYDLTAPFTKDLYQLDDSPLATLKTIYTTLENNHRFGGAPSNNIYDINLINATNTLLITNGSPSSNFSVNVSATSINGTIKLNDKSITSGLSMFSPDGTEYKLTIANGGSWSIIEV